MLAMTVLSVLGLVIGFIELFSYAFLCWVCRLGACVSRAALFMYTVFGETYEWSLNSRNNQR